MKKINKVTGYDYLKLKYDNKLVDKVFTLLNLNKEQEIARYGKRGSGNTSMLILEIVLTKLQTGVLDTVYIGRLPNGTIPVYELPRGREFELRYIEDTVKDMLDELGVNFNGKIH